MKNAQILFLRIASGLIILTLITHSTASFDPAFLIQRIGTLGSDNGEFNYPIDIDLIEDKYYVTDFGNHRVQVFDKDWNYVDKFGGFGSGIGQFNGPSDLAYNGSHIFVSDTANDRISIFDSSGNFIDSIGGTEGTALGEMNYPSSIDFGSGMIFVSENSNNRIQVYNESTLEPLVLFTHSNIQSPWSVQISGSTLFVTDIISGVIPMYEITDDLSFNYIGSIGTQGSEIDEIDSPYGVEIVNDHIVVAERFSNQLSIFNMNGEFKEQIKADFNQPYGVLIDGTSMFVTEAADDEITELRTVATPHSIEVIPGSSGISLTWKIDESGGSVNPDTYTVYRQSGNTTIELSTLASQSYTDLATVPGENYTYLVQANSILGSSEFATSDSASLISNPSSVVSETDIETVTATVTENTTDNGSITDNIPLSIFPIVGVLLLIPMFRLKSKN